MTAATTTWTVLQQAHDALRTAVAQVTADQWTQPTPCEQWNVAQVLQHATGDQRAYAAALTGQDGPTDNPFTPSGVLDGDPATLLDTALAVSAAAFAPVTPDDAPVPTPLPQGALAPALAVGACALDAAVHAWDIAVATGAPSPLTPALATALIPAATALADSLRPFAFAPALTPDPFDGPVATLLRHLGRTPTWAPPTTP